MPTIQDLLAQAAANQHTVDFGPFKLVVNVADGSGVSYRDESRREDFTDPLMRDLIARLKPQIFLDLGANFGFASMIHHHLNPTAAIVAVEMSPLLTPFIRKTFEINNITRATVVEAACGAAPSRMQSRLNVMGSQDNRVVPAAADRFLTTDSYDAQVVSVDQLLADLGPTTPVLVKIDTQGYERHVFAGAKETLARSSNWAIKTEFGPNWLKSQKTDAKEFLRELVDQYDVSELPQRSRFKGDRVEDLLRAKLLPGEVEAFVDWLANLNLHGKGWCDLLVTPKNRTW